MPSPCTDHWNWPSLGSAETDIVYQIGATVPSGFDGWAWCDDAVSTTRCDQHYVRLRANSVTNGLICHETGHAVGLTHGNHAAPNVGQTDARLGCMKTPVTANEALGSMNKANINETY